MQTTKKSKQTGSELNSTADQFEMCRNWPEAVFLCPSTISETTLRSALPHPPPVAGGAQPPRLSSANFQSFQVLAPASLLQSLPECFALMMDLRTRFSFLLRKTLWMGLNKAQ